MHNLFRQYLLPGFVFQGVVIGGGYATGRELAEFFMPHGPIGGLLGMGVSALVWSIVTAISFEICRTARVYDYRSFFIKLLGRFWFLYEILLFILMLLVLSVVGAAAGEVIRELAGFSVEAGTLLLLLAIAVMVRFGSRTIEHFMTACSSLLYIVYLALVIASFYFFGEQINSQLRAAVLDSGWALDGVRYAGYNAASIPMVFFTLRALKTRRQALSAGLIAGPLAMLPAVFLYTAMMSDYPQIGEAAVPSGVLLGRIGSEWLTVCFQLVLLGTLAQTGVGLIHSVNERLAHSFEERNRELGGWSRALIAAALLGASFWIAGRFGLVTLISRGYGALTYAFIAVFIVPVLTIGILYLRTSKRQDAPRTTSRSSSATPEV